MLRAGSSAMLRRRLAMGEEVIEALYGCNKKPIVALESTIISHGMPYPQNLEMAKTVEDIVRAQGACPATICIANGELKVGLSDHDLKMLAEMGSAARKCSTRDIPAAIAQRFVGATTVSSTMRIAHAAGIRMFVTGGIGGVHRFSEQTMDISTDLMELSRTPVAVVCAGIKSILDIPRTLEFLETHSVPVVGYQTDQFPAFFTQDSGLKAQIRTDTPRECAELIHESIGLELPNGFVVAVPNPNPMDSEQIKHAIDVGLREVQDLGIEGQAVTPYLLKRLNEITSGASLGSNIDLVMHNAKIGSQIARSLFELESEQASSGVTYSIMDREKNQRASLFGSARNDANVLVVGGLVLDIISASTESIIRGTSNIGTIRQTSGGVGRNIAECLRRLGVNPLLVSSVGSDSAGAVLLSNLETLGLATTGIQVSDAVGTAVYSAVLCSAGDLDVAVADMRALDQIDTMSISMETIKDSKLVVADGNLSPAALCDLLTRCAKANVRVLFEPTSVQKAMRIVEADAVQHVTYITPNGDELSAMSHAIREASGLTGAGNTHEHFQLLEKAAILSYERMAQLKNDSLTVLLEMAKNDTTTEKHIIVTMGKHGVLVASINVDVDAIQELATKSNFALDVWGLHHVQDHVVAMVHMPGVEIQVTNCTGAGDSLVGGTVYGLLKDHDVYHSCHLGMVAARQSLVSECAINPDLTQHVLETEA